MIINSLVAGIPAILNVMLVCVFCWLIFSILGVQLFAGKFFKCVYPEDYTTVPYEITPNKSICLAKNYTWANSRVNFDNVLNGYIALIEVATFKGWIEIMVDAADVSFEVKLSIF